MLANPEWEQQQLFSLDKPSLKALSYLLRHKELWPRGFRWSYSDCRSCAMGLADVLWQLHIPMIKEVDTGFPKFKNILNIASTHEARQIFVLSNYRNGKRLCDTHDVTPEMVADKIDSYLEASKI